MKTLFRRDKHGLMLLGIMGSAILMAFPLQSAMAARKGKSGGKVEIKNDVILMHPAVKLSAADEKAMNDILEKHSKALYKIDTLENGKVTRTNGSLADASITATLKAEIAAAEGKKHGGNIRTAQVVCPAPCNQTQVPPILIFKSTSPAARQKLIQELKPVLQKYQ